MIELVVVAVVVVVVVVEWLYYSKRIIIVRWADLSDFSSIFVGKMCIVVSRPMKIVTFLRKKRDSSKQVVDFSSGKRHIPKQNHGNRQGF